MKLSPFALVLISSLVLILAWSLWNPHDMFTWFLEVAPALVGAFILIISVCVSISAYYEMIEWWTAASMGESAESSLGTQGDIWDAQWDMFLCFTGAVTALIALSGVHDKQLAKIG